MEDTGLPQLAARVSAISAVTNLSYRIMIEVRPTTSKLLYDVDVFESKTQGSLVRGSGLTISEAAWYAAERLTEVERDLNGAS